jgi:putative DNA primase/helicase
MTAEGVQIIAAAWFRPSDLGSVTIPLNGALDDRVRLALHAIEDCGADRTAVMERSRLTSREMDAVMHEVMTGPPPLTELLPKPSINRTDAGNAERLVARHGARIRYVHGWDRWHVWDGSRWARDERREVESLAIDSARTMLVEAAALSDSKDREALAKHALRSEERHAIDDALALARSRCPVAIVPDDLDRNPDLLNLPNGTLDLSTADLKPHDPALSLTKATPVPWDPGAPSPTWDAFLSRVIPDPEVRTYLQRAVGYSLTGNVSEHALFFCYGIGANGKTTFLERVRELLGEGEAGYAKAAAPHLLLATRQDRHLAEVADLRGARFVTTVEVGEGRAWDEAKVKWLTGGDAISARFMYGNPFTFSPTHKFWIAGNHKPKVHGTDHGFWRRVHLIPFTVTIPKAEQDRDLPDRLRAELPGILRWAVEGCLAWRSHGLQPPAAVTQATREYRDNEDVIGAFLDECCIPAPGKHVHIGPLHQEFQAWADRNGEHPMSKRTFGDALEERGYPRARATGGDRPRVVSGLQLRTEGRDR